MIGGQGREDSSVGHQYKAHGVAERPFLVGPPAQEIHGPIVEAILHEDHIDSDSASQIGQEVQDGIRWELARVTQGDEPPPECNYE